VCGQADGGASQVAKPSGKDNGWGERRKGTKGYEVRAGASEDDNE